MQTVRRDTNVMKGLYMKPNPSLNLHERENPRIIGTGSTLAITNNKNAG